MNGLYNFNGSAEYAYDDNNYIGNGYSLEPLQEVTLYLYASIPDEVANDLTEGTLASPFRDGNQYQMSLIQ